MNNKTKAIVKLISWIESIQNSIFGITAPEVEAKILQQVVEKAMIFMNEDNESIKSNEKLLTDIQNKYQKMIDNIRIHLMITKPIGIEFDICHQKLAIYNEMLADLIKIEFANK